MRTKPSSINRSICCGSRYLSVTLMNQAALEYARHGFVRRLGTLKRCIENVYSIYPPERLDKPSRNECLDLAIKLQSFIFNVFGRIDNLAWVWVKEREIRDKRNRPLRGLQVGLRSDNVAVYETFSHEFQQYLIVREPWFAYLDGSRHALAHRIPLYVAPYTLTPTKLDKHNELETRKTEARRQQDYELCLELDDKQEALGKFTPWMMHSFSEGAVPVAFHFQVLADWNTVVEIANKFLEELRSRQRPI